MNTVAIIDNDVRYSAKLTEMVNAHPDFEVVAEMSSQDANILIEWYSPDVIVVDIVMYNNDGVRIIKRACEYYKNYHPYIFVVTAMDTPAMRRMLEELERGFWAFKPVKESDINNVLDQISYALEEDRKNGVPRPKIRDFTNAIEDTMHEVGTRPGLLGYIYAKLALRLILDNPDRYVSVYKEVPALLNITRSSFDRCLRTMVESCVDTELYRQLFGKFPVPNLDFVHKLAVYIERRVRDS